MHSYFAKLQALAAQPNQAAAIHHELLTFHQHHPDSIIKGRNVMAGYARGWGLQFHILRSFVEQDPIFQESFHLVKGFHLTHEVSLMNIFLIMKYGLPDTSGDIIEFGCHQGGSAIFMANVAKRLGLKTTIYTLDTFQGLPYKHPTLDFLSTHDSKQDTLESLKNLIARYHLANLIPIKGLFQETAMNVFLHSQKILLAYLDCNTYASTHYALSAVLPQLHPSGGYLLLHDPIHGNGLGALQAMEEMVETHHLHAEQAYPHMVYRYPQLR